MNESSLLETPVKQRYPAQLSHGTQPLPRTSDVPLSSEPSSQHEYSSLAELLTKAGYKETRVFTPEAEKIRTRSRQPTQTVRPRDSTAILRSIAMQDQAQAQADSAAREKAVLGESSTWYQGPLAALGWPAGGPEGAAPSQRKVGDSPVHPLNVGLGLAQGGQGVRRVKSAWDVAPRNLELDSPTLRPNQPVRPMVMADPPASIAQLFSPSMDGLVEQPQHVVDDEYGFDYGGQPLPDDYEATGSEDDYGSLDYDSESRTRESTADAEDIEKDLVSLSLGSVSGSGSSEDGPDCVTPRLANFPTVIPLDDMDDEDERDFDDHLQESQPITPPRLSPTPSRSPTPVAQRPGPIRTVTPPRLLSSPSKSTAAQVKVTRPRGPVPRSKAEAECMGLLDGSGQRKPALKSVKSTPMLRTQPSSGWLGALSRGFWKTSEPAPPMPMPRVAPGSVLSPSQPAPPALNVESHILCDSHASESEDLPPILQDTPLDRPAAPWTLRIRPSLQALRDAAAAAMGKHTLTEPATSPILSPKLDWGVGGDSDELKGWGMTPVSGVGGKQLEFAMAKGRLISPDKVETESSGLYRDPDFTQSFFYKPPTPERPRLRRSGTSETTTSPPRASSANGTGQTYPVVKRARSIQSLRAALLLPVRPPSPPPPVPALPRTYSAPLPAPTKRATEVEPPIMVISSPGAWEAGLPPRELVLEGEEWDARESPEMGRGIRKGSLKGKGKKKLRKSPLGR